MKYHGIIGVHSLSPKLLGHSLNLGSPLIPNLQPPPPPPPPLIYLVGLLAISEPHINIYVGSPNTCVALKQFNLLPRNTLF